MKFNSQITQISKDGLGVCEGPNNKQYFVFGTWIDEKGEFEVLDQKHPNKKFGYAKIVHLTHTHPKRIESACENWGINPGQCQSCTWPFMQYQEQLEQKMKRLVFSFSRYGNFDISKIVKPIIPSEKAWGYRNRLSLKSDGAALGYVSRKTHILSSIKSCPIANETINDQIKKVLKSPLPSSVKHKFALIELDDEKGILINKKHTFRQANDETNIFMRDWVLEKLKRSAGIIEFFCGSGNFTKIIAQNTDTRILAMDSNPKAIETLSKLLLDGVKPKVLDIIKAEPKTFRRYNTLFLDPPREGLKNLSAWVQKSKHLTSIVYISCNSDTMARDLGPLLNSNWTLKEIVPVDQFPQTTHFETLAYLELSMGEVI